MRNIMRTRQEEAEYHRQWVAKNPERAREIALYANRRHKLKLAFLRVIERIAPSPVKDDSMQDQHNIIKEGGK